MVRQAEKDRSSLNREITIALENWALLKDPNSLDPLHQPKP